MKLVVPYLGEVLPVDARLIRVAEFLGIECQPLSLEKPAAHHATYFHSVADQRRSCLIINPDVMKDWMDTIPPSLCFVSRLFSQFGRVLIHAVRPDAFHSALVAALTAGCFSQVRKAQNSEAVFSVAPDSRDICAAFAGISIGAASPANDRIFSEAAGEGGRILIRLGGDAFFAVMRFSETEVFLIGSEDVVDLDAETGDDWLSESFSRFLPHAMALRHIFGKLCWRPAQSHACVIVDDPLLRANYGFLNFDQLLRLMEQHNFATTIAFIPHNFRRSSARIVRIFREHADRLSLCFHGNDHTSAEFATTEKALLNRMLQTAESRIAAHNSLTGLACDRIMVFPQGKFSVAALAALQSHNFDAAVNTVLHPHMQPVRLTLRELAQPAVLRYAGFPLFLRRSSLRMQEADIAFRLFFGIPILIVEHHEIFENPRPLIDAVGRINRATPEIHWSSAGVALRGSFLRRRDLLGNLHVVAYARTVQVENLSSSPERIFIRWNCPGQKGTIESVHCNGIPCTTMEVNEPGLLISSALGPGASAVFSVQYRQKDTTIRPVGLRYRTGAFVRRRLSEIRDNYISKSPSLLAAARTLQYRVQHLPRINRKYRFMS